MKTDDLFWGYVPFIHSRDTAGRTQITTPVMEILGVHWQFNVNGWLMGSVGGLLGQSPCHPSNRELLEE